MTTFVEFRDEVAKNFDRLAKVSPLFQSSIEKDVLRDLYLDSFPEGTNPIYRERTEHDCACCKSYVRNVGRILAIVKGELVSIWDNLKVSGEYKVVAEAMAKACKEAGISGIYLNDDQKVGNKSTLEQVDGKVVTWNHFYQVLPAFAYSKRHDIGERKGRIQTGYKALRRSVVELSEDAVTTVSDLIDQNLIHRGNEQAPVIRQLKTLQREYKQAKNPDLYLWLKIVEIDKAGHNPNIRGTSIGTLLVDLTEEVDLEIAVKKYEDKVSGTNYKRTTALVTPQMRDSAKAKAKELGIEPSFPRRHATREDISVNDVLFADSSIKPFMEDSVFDVVDTSPKRIKEFEGVGEVTAEHFIEKILPSAHSVEVFLENRHESNLMSLVAPVNAQAPCIMKWGNNFSWSYNGEVAESVIRQRVKDAGGVVDAPFRISLSWNSRDDLDLHLYRESTGHVYYASKTGINGLRLDVDMRGERLNQVENIFAQNLRDLPSGKYSVRVHNFNYNGSRRGEDREEGFTVEMDHEGDVLTLQRSKKIPDRSWVDVATFTVDAAKNITIKPQLPSSSTVGGKEMWGISSGEFHKVNMVMRSPNMWDNANKSGNDHLFFILENCVNPDEVRGFYNEFLIQELNQHRKVFEILSANLKAEHSDNQLSGLGFSSTLRNEVIVKVKGSFNRMVKIKF